MNIYISHSRKFDFKTELYQPLRESELGKKHYLVFPHADSDKLFDSKTYLKERADLMIAEVSYPSFGVGIELGWADAFGVPIVCVYKKGAKVSSSLRVVSKGMIEYS